MSANKLVLEGARLKFKNFSGKPSPYNREGDRNFCVIIDDPNLAQQLSADGWNVRVSEPREEGDMPEYYIQAKLNYKSALPPCVYLVVNGGPMVLLEEENLNRLDYANIVNVDLSIAPYHYENISGNSGISAYVRNMVVCIEEDTFLSKYQFDDSQSVPY